MKCPCEKLNDGCQDWSELCVGNLWLFSGLQREELFEVSQKARRRTFSVGEAVFHQGDPAHSIYLIKSGQIKLSRVIENGAEIMLDILKPGDCLGEYLLNDLTSDYGYPVSAWCQSKVITCSFDRRAFEELILEFPAIGLKVIKTMAGRITSLTERLEAMSQTHLEDKLHAVLLNVARKHGHQRSVGSYALDFQLTHEDLGFLVGAHRVSVTRMMKRLKASGRIDSEGKLYIVHSSAETDLGSH